MDKSSESLTLKLSVSSPEQSTSAASTPDADMLTPEVEHMEDIEGGSAPIEMLSEFLSAVMSRDYEAALNYCKTILLYEPSNKIVQEFYPLIQERILQAHQEPEKEEMDSDENTGGEDDDNDNSSFSSKSASSSEFTSGGSDLRDLDNEDENGNSTSNSTSDDYSSTEDGGWKTALNTDSDSTEKDNEADSNSNTDSPTLHIDVCANHLQSLSL